MHLAEPASGRVDVVEGCRRVVEVGVPSKVGCDQRLETPMSMVQDIRCKLRLHRWGPVLGDDWGAHQVCDYCGHTRRLGVEQPPDAHDHSGINR